MNKTEKSSINNIYQLDGRVPISRAFPFGLQHILAMFVGNIAPILVVAGALGMNTTQSAALLQNAMLIAGIGTLIQLFPLWKIGSRLPIVMGISFTFVTVICFVGTTYGYGVVLGAVLAGGIIEGVLGLFAKYWIRLISPIVSASVVTAIGFSLLAVGATSFGGGDTSAKNFGNMESWIIGGITLLSCIFFQIFAKSYYKQLSVLFGLIVGYVVAVLFGAVDFSALHGAKIVALPHLLPYRIEFNINAIISVTLIFLVSATETIGDSSALAVSGLQRDITSNELSGSICCDGFVSALSSLFGCIPITSYSQNVGLVAMTRVVNRYTIGIGAVILVLAGIFPPIGALLATLPNPVLGGCTLMMFGSIVVSGIQMIGKAGYTQRNIVIAALSLSIGIGFTQVPKIFAHFPLMAQNVFAQNCVAVTFLVAVILNLVLPKNMEAHSL